MKQLSIIKTCLKCAEKVYVRINEEKCPKCGAKLPPKEKNRIKQLIKGGENV
jgi:rRNA maturation endonuclease Nob1